MLFLAELTLLLSKIQYMVSTIPQCIPWFTHCCQCQRGGAYWAYNHHKILLGGKLLVKLHDMDRTSLTSIGS